MSFGRYSLLACVLVGLAVACSSGGDSADDNSSSDGETQPLVNGPDNNTVDCTEKQDTAYVQGKATPITLITIGGKVTTKAAGHAYLKMLAGAKTAGARLVIASGFRTMAEQQHLYQCYQTHSCNNGNLAAKPGYSNHQSGIALDFTTSSWLAANASKFGFVRTVPSEDWHYEYHGDDPGGQCDGASSTKPDAGADASSESIGPSTSGSSCSVPGVGAGTCIPTADCAAKGGDSTPGYCPGGADIQCCTASSVSAAPTCFASTLDRDVPEGACVLSSADQVWEQCHDGNWYRGADSSNGPYGPCTESDGSP
jgi:hypothetical protein